MKKSNSLPLLLLLRRYIERDPSSAAQLLKTLEEGEAASVLKALPPQLCAELFPHLDVNYATALLQNVTEGLLEAVVKRMSPEQAALVLRSLQPELKKSLLDHFPEELKKQIQELLTYPQNSAGQIMSTQFMAFHQDLKVKDAIQRIRASANRYSPSTYTYVVDDENHLVGVLNMRDLLLSPNAALVKNVMDKNVFAVNAFMDREEVSQQLHIRHFFAAPVMDTDRRLVGVVKTEHLYGQAQEQATEDLLKMVGAGEDERAFSPIGFSLRKRLLWLHINLGTAFLAAAVVALFEDIIAKITVLAVFLPVVAGQGGNAGAQSLAVVMRGLVLREIKPPLVWKLILKEGTLGTLNGLIIGVVTALLAWFLKGNPYLGLVIGLGMLVNLTAAGLSGAAIPLGMKALGWDPAQSSSIILTTVTDVVGFFAFLGFAVMFQAKLM